jgi:HAE1 family hydrophobic/amphiphilic exporter-1
MKLFDLKISYAFRSTAAALLCGVIVVLAATANAQDPPAAPPTVQTAPTPPIRVPANPPVQTTTPVPQAQATPTAQPSGTPAQNPATPGQNIGNSGVVPPAQLPAEPPPIAPDFQAPTRPLPSAERVGVDVANQLPLTLEQAIEMALQNNNNIDVSRNNVRIAEFNFRGAKGIYDPLLSGQSYYENATTPTATAIGGAVNGAVNQTRLFNTAGVSGFTPWGGGQYSAQLTTTRSRTSNTNSFLNPQYPTSLVFEYTQPLLRNFGFDNNRRQIEIAKKNLSMSDAQFRQQAIEVIAQVEQAYWNLVFALRDLQVQIDAVKEARTQLESNQRLVAKGVLAPIEIVAASAQITTFEQTVYTAEEVVTRQENILKTLLLADRSSEIWKRAITPISPVSLDAPQVSLDIALAEAIKNRPELTQLETSREINKIDQRFYKNQTKPQVDLVASYTSQGLAGTVTPRGVGVVPDNLIGGYINSFGNLLQQDYPTYRVGVTISLPWGNTVAKANLGRSLVEGERIENQRAQQEQVIESEVRNSVQSLRSAEARLASAAATRASAEQLYESEQRQFRAGTSTFYLVTQRQTELRAARSRELLAQTLLNQAISDFQHATGTTLSANNVTVSQGVNLKKIAGTSSFPPRAVFSQSPNE